jgi:hypothetical protein
MKELTAKQATILGIMAEHPGADSPTVIGVYARQPDSKAGSWAQSGLKALVEKGLVEKADKGVSSFYRLTEAGRKKSEELRRQLQPKGGSA